MKRGKIAIANLEKNNSLTLYEPCCCSDKSPQTPTSHYHEAIDIKLKNGKYYYRVDSTASTMLRLHEQEDFKEISKDDLISLIDNEYRDYTF